MSKPDVARPQQNCWYGSLPFVSINPIYTVLARKIKILHSDKSLTAPQLMESMCKVLGHQMRRANRAGKYRDAQALALLEHFLMQELEEAAREHGDLLVDALAYPRPALDEDALGNSELKFQKISSTESDQNVYEQKKLSPPGTLLDVATPLARPSLGNNNIQTPASTPPLDLNFGSLDLSPEKPRESQRPRDTHNTSSSPPANHASALSAQPSSVSNTSGQSERAMSVPDHGSPDGRRQLRGSMDGGTNHRIPFPPDRHNSGESFQIFPSSVDSQKLLSAHGSFVDGIQHNQGRSMTPSPKDSRTTLRRHDSVESSAAFPLLATDNSDLSSLRTSSPEVTRSSRSSVEGGSRRRVVANQLVDNGSNLPYEDVGKKDIGSLHPKHVDTHLNDDSDLLERSQSTIVHDTYGSPSISTAAEAGESLAVSLPMQCLQQILHYHAEQGEAQAASNVFITVAPLLAYLSNFSNALNNKLGSSNRQSDMHVSSFINTLVDTLQLTPASAAAMIKSSQSPFQVAHLSPLFIESLLTTYHDTLTPLQLHQEASLLRKLAFPAFPAVYDFALKEIYVAILCSCGNPVDMTHGALKCEACLSPQPDCPICWQRASPFSFTDFSHIKKKNRLNLSTEAAGKETEVLVTKDPTTSSLYPNFAALQPSTNEIDGATTIMTACPLCAHVVHAACSLTWFAEGGSEGICPVEDCMCACVPGSHRDELNAAEEVARARAAAGSRIRRGGSLGTMAGFNMKSTGALRGDQTGAVRRDSWEVRESKAVSRVGDALRDTSDMRPASDGEKAGDERRNSEGGAGARSKSAKRK